MGPLIIFHSKQSCPEKNLNRRFMQTGTIADGRAEFFKVSRPFLP